MILTPDTNLLVYAQDAREPRKRELALQVVGAMNDVGSSLVGLQVVGEFNAVLVRRLKQPPALACETVLATLRMFATFGYTEADVHVALDLSARGVFSYWDGLLVASAARVGCTHLISEDMQDGFRFGELEIVSPFPNGRVAPRLAELIGNGAG